MTLFYVLLMASTAGAKTVRLDDAKASMAERVKAAQELGKSKKRDVKAINALLRGIEGPGEELVGAVRTSLRALEAGAVLGPRALDDEAPLNERREAVKGLRCVKDPSTYAALAKLLGSTHEVLRREAAFALTVGGAAEAEAELVKALSDESNDVRYFAAVALGELKTPAAVKAIGARKQLETEATVKDALIQASAKQQR